MPPPKKVQLPPELQVQLDILLDASKSFDEHNDCGVISVALVTGLPYRVVHAELEALGRKRRQGTWYADQVSVIRKYGFELIDVLPLDIISSFPVPHCNVLRNVTTYHPQRFPGSFDASKRYLLYCKTHVAAVIGGLTVDWTCGRAMRVMAIREIRKTQPMCKESEPEK